MVPVSTRRRRRPKVKGCYECSQRRINCDRTEPSCEKCTHKGISCSGLGVRYRFNQGVASRGKLIGKNITGENTQVAYPAVESPCTDAHVSEFKSYILFLSNCLDPLGSWNRYLVTYFGEHIAPAMVAIDDASNGYRAIILPVVEWHRPVLNAVIASSAYHIALKLGSQTEALQHAQTFYIKAIDELMQLSSDVNTESTQTSRTLTTVVMLVCAMITGSSDFPILYKMLEYSIQANNTQIRRGKLAFDSFVGLQMRKFELYAGPFLDPKVAMNRFNDTESIDRGLGCLFQCSQLHPEHSIVLERASRLIHIACLIYSLRVRNELSPGRSHQLVEQYRDTISQYHHESPGWKILIWPTFIVAAETVDHAHRLFFTSLFHDFFKRTGFGNLFTALNILQSIWQDAMSTNWAEALPQWKSFIM